MDSERLRFPPLSDGMSYDSGLASCMAAHSDLVYKGHRKIAQSLTSAGFDRVIIFREGGTNAYLARSNSSHESGKRCWVLAWRGTEADYQDIIADVTFFKRTSDYAKRWRVHGGFLSAMQTVWGSWWDPELPEDREGAEVLRAGSRGITEVIAEEVSEQDRVVVTGHSLGGALAQLSAFYIHRDLSPSEQRLAAVYTFGSPRVFGAKQAKHLDAESPYPHFRVVNGADLVPRVPPLLLGFRHAGRNVYIKRNGSIREDPSWLHVFTDVGWRQAFMLGVALLLVWAGFTWLEAATQIVFSGLVKAVVMVVIAVGVVMLLPKLLHILPGKTRWRLVCDHFMDAYERGVSR